MSFHNISLIFLSQGTDIIIRMYYQKYTLYVQVVSCTMHEAYSPRLEARSRQSFRSVPGHSLPPAYEMEGPPFVLSSKAEVGLHHFPRPQARGGAEIQG